MNTISINADEALWRNNMLPEGILERWLVVDGAIVREGHAVAEIRIEGALHDIVAPATGRLTVSAPRLAVIEPGYLLATLTVDAEVGAGA
jgi:pyruvate/2-oxoglutarate dehydrogenase complex dihydrolipoamide acyltransferase (E2) component